MRFAAPVVLFVIVLDLAVHDAWGETKPNVIVILTDDQGFADLGIQGSVDDVLTPHIDALAKNGVRMSHGYVTAPQCVPSRAGLLTGRHQQRFGLEVNRQGPLPLQELTIAERLKPAGYVSGVVGKWHLDGTPSKQPGGPAAGPGSELSSQGQEEGQATELQPATDPRFLPEHQGFDEFFIGSRLRYIASHDLEGRPLRGEARSVTDARFRIDVQTEAALSFIRRHADERFFLYLGYSAPHAPLDATPKYVNRFPDATGARKLGLAMISAIDDGVGRIVSVLRELALEDETIIFFLSDNGAQMRKAAWNGSLNTPLLGGKGLLTDGGIRVPFILSWKGVLPAGRVYEHPVSSLDIAATAIAAAGLPVAPELDGVNLAPYLLGEKAGTPHPTLYWRWRSQAAIRKGRWKLVKLANEQSFLFDLESAEGERRNVRASHPELAASLDAELREWASQFPWKGFSEVASKKIRDWFEEHVR
jgi:arylsulfatase A-like enzyme